MDERVHARSLPRLLSVLSVLQRAANAGVSERSQGAEFAVDDSGVEGVPFGAGEDQGRLGGGVAQDEAAVGLEDGDEAARVVGSSGGDLVEEGGPVGVGDGEDGAVGVLGVADDDVPVAGGAYLDASLSGGGEGGLRPRAVAVG